MAAGDLAESFFEVFVAPCKHPVAARPKSP